MFLIRYIFARWGDSGESLVPTFSLLTPPLTPHSAFLPHPLPPGQTTFLHKGFDDTRRLGLPRSVEERVRQVSPAEETGMLVVEIVVPGGPADAKLEAGDVLVEVNGMVSTDSD